MIISHLAFNLRDAVKYPVAALLSKAYLTALEILFLKGFSLYCFLLAIRDNVGLDSKYFERRDDSIPIYSHSSNPLTRGNSLTLKLITAYYWSMDFCLLSPKDMFSCYFFVEIIQIIIKNIIFS